MGIGRLTVLTVDDNADNLTALRAVIREVFPTADVVEAADGATALELARTRDPDVILLDIVMPGMDGFEVCSRLKQDRGLRHVPVVFVTALGTDKPSRIRAIEVGAEGFLGKPIDNVELSAQLRTMARISAANRQQARSEVALTALVHERTRELQAELSERRRAEDDYHTLFREMRDGFTLHQIVCNDAGEPIDSRFVAVNPAFERMTGLSADAVIGRTVLELMPTAETVWIERFGHVALSGEPAAFESYASALGKWFAVTAFRPAPLQFACIVVDVTERRRTQDALADSESRYRALFSSMSEGFYLARLLFDEQGRTIDFVYLDVNPAFERLMGLERSQLVGRRAKEIVPVLDPQWLELLGSVVRTGQPARRSGPSAYLQRHMEIHAFRPAEGQVAVLLSDITDRKRSEDALRESEERFRAAFDDGAIAMALTGLDGALLRVNAAYCQLVGYTAEELTGRTFSDLTHPADLAANLAGVDRLSSGRAATFRMEKRYLRKDGTVVWVDMSTATVCDAAGAPKYLVTHLQDMTERQRAEQALTEAHADMQASNALLEQRVAERTVELRALAGEITLSEERERRRIAAVLHDGVQQLLIGARLRLAVAGSTSESVPGGNHLQRADELIAESIEISRGLSHQLSPAVLHEEGLASGLEWLGGWMGRDHGLRVAVDADRAANPVREDVRVLLFQAVRELLMNVVKHACVSEALVSLALTDMGEIEVVVIDEGAGFDPALAMPLVGRRVGFGLLGIQERLRLFGGRIEVDSAEGRGSCFRLIVPPTQHPSHAGVVAGPGSETA